MARPTQQSLALTMQEEKTTPTTNQWVGSASVANSSSTHDFYHTPSSYHFQIGKQYPISANPPTPPKKKKLKIGV